MPGKELIPRPLNLPARTSDGELPWSKSPERRSEAAVMTIARWARRDRHYTVPLAIPVVLWPAGMILHAVPRSPGYVLFGGAVLIAAMAVLAPHKWEAKPELAFVLGSAVLAPLWLWLAAWLGPASGVTGIVLSAVLGAGAVAWGVPWWRHKRPRGRLRRQKLAAKWDAWWQSHCYHWSLGGSHVIDVWESKNTAKVRVKGVPGRHSIKGVEQVLHLVESALEGVADVGMVRVTGVKGDGSMFDFYFKRENPLGKVVEYDAAVQPRSVHDRYPAGLSETSVLRMLRMRCNRFVIGESRSGKSNDLLVGIAALTGCADDRQVLIDLKGGRSARPLLEIGAVDYVITDIDEARMYLRMLAAEIPARAKYAYTGEEQLEATPECPAIHTLIDETHGLTSVANGDAECARLLGIIASQGMGLEIYTWVYTQYGSLEESVRTEQTRMNLTVRSVYRVAEARHGSYAIPEYTKLDASKLEETGTCYIKDGAKAAPEQVRAPKVPHPLLKRIVAQNLQYVSGRPQWQLYCGNEPAAGTGGTWGEWWATRWTRLDPAFREISPQYQAAIAEHPRIAAQVRREAAESQEPVPAPVPGEGDARAAAARIDAEMNELRAIVPDGFRPDPKIVAAMPKIARTQKERWADALAAASSGITPKQLMAESGMGSTWTHQTLAALAEAEAVTKLGRGLYTPLGTDIHEAIRAIEARGDELLADARRDGGGTGTPAGCVTQREPGHPPAPVAEEAEKAEHQGCQGLRRHA